MGLALELLVSAALLAGAWGILYLVDLVLGLVEEVENDRDI